MNTRRAVNAPLLTTLVLLLVHVASAGTPASDQALLILKSDQFADTEATVADLALAGGHAMHVIPPRVIIARVPVDREGAVQAIPNVGALHREAITPTDPEVDQSLALGTRAWQRLTSPPAAAKAQTGSPLIGDAIDEPRLSLNASSAAASQAPDFYATSEFMIGKVAVGVILPESTGSGENWSTGRQATVFNEIVAGLNWWVTRGGTAAHLTFYYDQRFSVPTTYEPITLSSSDHGLWIADVMQNMGYGSGDYFNRTRSYINSIRSSLNTDWSFAILVVDSLNDADGKFTNGYFGYAYLHGPFVVMTYDNDGWGISNMDTVTTHETGHIFGAADEYCSPGYACCSFGNYGYLNVYNGNCESGNPNSIACMMRGNENTLCSYTVGQIGWRDTDADGKPDTIDNTVDNILNTYPSPTTQTVLTLTGTATDFPCVSPTRTDFTINKISSVKYRINSGAWTNALPTDGQFNSDSEAYTFTTPTLIPGNHLIETQAFSTSGNSSPIASQNVCIPLTAPPTVSASDSFYCDKIRVSWDAVSGATSYDIYRSTTNSRSTSVKIATDPDSASPFDDDTAVCGTIYYYWVKAAHGCSISSFSPSNSGTLACPPSVPTDVTATDAIYSHQVRISWSSAAGATCYDIYRNTTDDSATATRIASDPDCASPFDDFTAIPGATYYYWVKATIATCESGFSNSDGGSVLWLPTVASESPARGSGVPALPWIEVTFTKSVTGVVAANLMVNGSAATSISGSGAGPYRFSGYENPAAGVIDVAVLPGAIQDLEGNPFPGDAWTYAMSSPLNVLAWRSVRTHTGAGPLSIALHPTATGNGAGGPTSESRQGGVQRIEVDFDGPATLAPTYPTGVSVIGRTTADGVMGQPTIHIPVSIELAGASTIALTFAANQLPDQTCYTITLNQDLVNENLANQDLDVNVRALAGDANSQGQVNVGDTLLIKSKVSPPTLATAAPACDYNLSGGTINLGDSLAVRALVTSPPHEVRCP